MEASVQYGIAQNCTHDACTLCTGPRCGHTMARSRSVIINLRPFCAFVRVLVNPYAVTGTACHNSCKMYQPAALNGGGPAVVGHRHGRHSTPHTPSRKQLTHCNLWVLNFPQTPLAAPSDSAGKFLENSVDRFRFCFSPSLHLFQMERKTNYDPDHTAIFCPVVAPDGDGRTSTAIDQ